MKRSGDSSGNFSAIVGIASTILFIFLFVWFIQSLPMPTQDDSPTAEEAASYEEYRSEELMNENAEQEACINQMERDVERYGESAISTYDCTK